MITTQPANLPLTRPQNAPPYFHVMAKPTGAICNLDCKYCFFLSKEALYPGSPFRMGEDVLEALQYAAAGQGILAGLAILFCALILDRIVAGRK